MCVKGTVAIVWRKNLREGRLEGEPLGQLQSSEENSREGHGMKLGECLLDLVGRKPVGSWERASLSRAGQVETRCSDLGVKWR